MKITQVRNATLLIHYAGTRFLIDPMLAPKGSYPGFEGMANSHLRNPLVELPLPMATLLEGAYAYAPDAEHREGIAAFLAKRPPEFQSNQT